MNRLIFSEGGQPVFLEDLKMLQDNMVDLVMSLFPITDGETQGSGCDDDKIKDVRNLPIYSTPRHLNGNADTNSKPCKLISSLPKMEFMMFLKQQSEKLKRTLD